MSSEQQLLLADSYWTGVKTLYLMLLENSSVIKLTVSWIKLRIRVREPGVNPR
jgi:hypothetical protein